MADISSSSGGHKERAAQREKPLKKRDVGFNAPDTAEAGTEVTKNIKKNRQRREQNRKVSAYIPMC